MKGILFAITFLASFTSLGQGDVEWAFSFDNESNNLVMSAKIEDGWHLYSQIIDEEVGPIPTEFEFETNDSYNLIGATVEPEPIKEFDKNFDGELTFFEKEVVFTQEIENIDAEKVNGIVTYMVCNDEMCMPPIDKEFTITIKE